MKDLNIVVLVGLGLLSAACSLPVTRAYDGTPRLSSEVAILKNSANQVKEIDGRSWPCADVCGDYELLPGPHSVTVDISGLALTAQPLTASFVAGAGHVYAVRTAITSPGGSTWVLSIKDLTTGKVVYP